MASFPTSAITFASRSNGQVIDASHINSLQDEVAAIEAGYLDASARLNSSNSTVANLSVAGGSTFTGAVTFSSGVTVSTHVLPASTTSNLGSTAAGFKEIHCSSLYVSGVAVGAGAPSVRLIHSAITDVAHGVNTGMSWDTEVVDANGLHSTATNSSRITFSPSTGTYVVGASIEWNQNSSGARIVSLFLNDSSAVAANAATALGGGFQHPQSISALVRVSDTADYVTVRVLQASGSTGSVAANSTLYGTAFWAHRVST